MKRSQERKVRIPNIEITKFNGEVKKWLLFWGQFMKIDEDPDINDSDKFQYLLQSMEPHSNARQLVESYPPSGKNYKKALESLKSRVARDDVLIETYVRGLLALMQEKGQRPSNAKELPALYDSLQTHLQALETLGVTKDKYASILFPMVESALPDEILRAWNRYRAADNKINNDLSRLVDFLRLKVESEERIQLAHQGTTHNSITDPKVPTCCFVAEIKPENHKSISPVCIWCDKDTHCTAECHKAAKITLEQRTEFIKAKKACLICLRSNHTAKRCKSFPQCLFRKKRHSVLMCPDMSEQSTCKNKTEPEKSNNLHCELKSTTLLQTIVVQVVSNDSKKFVRARALIDSGAQRSYVRKDLVEKLNLKPKSDK
ncbi:uncharacterized protein [Choristoneura fumiferana]|uniref:uncharacterized protein n=1 Tax=Choristoneura fumiferana TaxID=7141 RepID=UPI003D15711A